ncbi:hypothetical protein TRFO_17925 [Tritrichomonas foetus]|uniref:MSP domain-containing protein n=1 Tax=Tritrichomonas foetus TaxID=1144522 RepID=A0A1J4KS83_9EUKA|nr:hypothetical protein TRFO_17925 [Tritrichomonas foetus]|eukprot:OHT12333.1 hypothetical protein TRFO_17925 [Tritrichomonas foetus]
MLYKILMGKRSPIFLKPTEMFSRPLILEPNPLILSKTGRIHNKGTIELKNISKQTILFQLSFDPDVFCGISPACGELDKMASRSLTFLLEDTNRDLNELTFTIKYFIVPPDSTPDQITDIMMNQNSWKDTITATIKFSSHAEDAMKSVSSAFKTRNSLKKAIAREENNNLDEEERAMLERKIGDKEAQKAQLERKVESLRQQLEKKNEESVKFARNPTVEYNLVYIGIIILLLAILKRKIFN